MNQECGDEHLEWAEVEQRLHRAVAAFMNHDAALLEVEANERSMTHKFAEHLQREYPGWDVDCEYNRDRNEKKALRWMVDEMVPADDIKARTVFPDIIVHHRGTTANHLVIEAKKVSGDPDDNDRKKLAAFLNEFDYPYSFAVLLRFITGNAPDIEFKRVVP
jgi:hypothetical protein